MQLHEWITVQRDTLHDVAIRIAHDVQGKLAMKGKRLQSDNGKTLRSKELRIRVRRNRGFTSIEWLIRQWYKHDGKNRFTTRNICKGRALSYPTAMLTSYAREADLSVVLEAEKQFTEIRRRLRHLSALEASMKRVGCPLNVTVGATSEEDEGDYF